ncbi:MAG: hypothetical protein EOQ39_12570 [Mesorhizobium sp.]|uniref:hypothetical protein n=1 Tax=unclassified Mesorhizobium TaxID=325217 RepID=UPI000FCBA3B0|nr:MULTISPECIES: hypothetical protein [unclassified Mesorhizobium]RUV32714.1 hypothetical protein EOB49_32860 [Mesorhizobium sp. M7A.F.Ca.MR.148.00.0.0]RWB10037.1 MAG: hypothetical protein EOQ37_02465 [Mesorhizobium sp.]RWB15246.1 MAG: hypothetical protein EOQ39_12570 [Mesorhizobium sp.]RWN19161.1 MAG: hypothetical protein EOR94_16165 [Mesorhizobium sp.]RWO62633.1 MAG: hypothetical protein EOS17_29855 [Mesorhizobium sp.]
MPLITLYSTDLGVRRLMAQVKNYYPAGRYGDPVGLDQSSAAHADLFKQYRIYLQQAFDIAVPWWEAIIDNRQAPDESREDAIQEAFNRRVAGAASSPYVVWVVRKFWLSLETINETLQPGERVAPDKFLLQWLIDANETELVRLIACMPYWPIGIDENGHWC